MKNKSIAPERIHQLHQRQIQDFPEGAPTIEGAKFSVKFS